MKIFIALAVPVASWLLPAPVRAQVPSDAVVIAFSAQRSTVVSHEPVVIRFTIQNRLNEVVEFDLGGDYKSNIRVQLSRPQGASMALVPDRRGGLAELGTVRLPANQELSHQFVLDEMVTEGGQAVNLTAVGDYVA